MNSLDILNTIKGSARDRDSAERIASSDCDFDWVDFVQGRPHNPALPRIFDTVEIGDVRVTLLERLYSPYAEAPYDEGTYRYTQRTGETFSLVSVRRSRLDTNGDRQTYTGNTWRTRETQRQTRVWQSASTTADNSPLLTEGVDFEAIQSLGHWERWRYAWHAPFENRYSEQALAAIREYSPTQAYHDGLADIIDGISAFATGSCDLHQYNVMWRKNGECVLIDPIHY